MNAISHCKARTISNSKHCAASSITIKSKLFWGMPEVLGCGDCWESYKTYEVVTTF